MMNSGSRRLLTALGLGVAITLAASAGSFGAQRANPPSTQDQYQDQTDQAPQDEQDQRRGGRGNRQDGRRTIGRFIEQRLRMVHDRLGITPAQEQRWLAVANELRNDAGFIRNRVERLRDEFRGRRDGDRREDGARGDREAPSAVEQLQRRVRALREREARTERLIAVVRPLYAVLTPEQRRTADGLLLRAERVRLDRIGRALGRGGNRADRDRDRDGDNDRGPDRGY